VLLGRLGIRVAPQRPGGMATDGPVCRTAHELACRAIKRACYAGHDSVRLREAVARQLLAAVPADAYALTTTDPETGLFTHLLGEGLGAPQVEAFVGHVYPREERARLIELGRSGRFVATADAGAPGRGSLFHSELFHEWSVAAGVGPELRAAFWGGDGLLGTGCLLRARGSRPFSAGECALMERVAPHIARGLREAALLELAGQPDPAGEEAAGALPGFLLLGSGGRICSRDRRAAAQLEDLAGGSEPALAPPGVSVVAGMLRARFAEPNAEGDHRPLEARHWARGHSGRWYLLHASLLESGADGGCYVGVAICPLPCAERAWGLVRLYGLSPREREVVALAARGESTRAIARRLGISPYTVQDHLDHACEKVGVSGRRRLLAKLFFGEFAARLAR